MPACSLLVDTSDLTGGPADAGGGGAKVDSGSGGGGADSAVAIGDASAPEASGGGGVDAAIPTCGIIPPGKTLVIDDEVKSCSGKYFVIFQGDGNFVLYGKGAGSALWATETYEKGADHVVMRESGEFVVLTGSDKPVFTTNTAAFPGSYFEVQDDGHVRVRSPDGVVRWLGQNY